MAVLLKILLVRINFIQIMQVRVQNKGKSVWKSRYIRDVSTSCLFLVLASNWMFKAYYVVHKQKFLE